MSELKVLHLSTHDYGGAGKAALRIHTLLKHAKINSKILVKFKRSNEEDVYKIDVSYLKLKIMKYFEVLTRRIQYSQKYNMYSVADSSSVDVIHSINALNYKPNIIILHWIANFISLNDLQLIKKEFNCEIFWYAMDMAPATGGCHFAWDCLQYAKGCERCPSIYWYQPLNYPREYFNKKKEVVRRLKIKAIASNQWVANQIKNSAVPFDKVDVCYLPIDEELFKPSNIQKEKNEHKPIKFFFGAYNFEDERKGGKYFLKALEKLKILIDKDGVSIYPIIMLPGLKSSYIDEKIPFEVVRYSFAETDKELAQLYQQADVFICSSIEDTGPMMVLESLMSGVPVIGFSVGVCPEVIQDYFNGFLIENRNITELAEAMFKFIKGDIVFLNNSKLNARKSVKNIMGKRKHYDSLINIISK